MYKHVRCILVFKYDQHLFSTDTKKTKNMSIFPKNCGRVTLET